MDRDAQAQFDAGAAAWADYNRTPLGRIRREVTWQNLARHLPAADPGRTPRALDAGGGSGELAQRLLQAGYEVWLLDYAPGMLEQARQAAQDLPQEIGSRLTCCPMTVDDAAGAFAPGYFDLVTCHTLIEYLPDPGATVRDLAGLLREGGLLSVSWVNRQAEVLRQIWSKGDPEGALASLNQEGFRASLFDLTGVAYGAGEVAAWIRDAGLAVTGAYGVRAFADYVPRQRLEEADFFEALLRLELAAADQAPYRLMARYLQTIAHKQGQD
jgi:2-polyprenyl-3-methyl-5-hydroxy-6-metoxy-1,4-benzoquinol methylase